MGCLLTLVYGLPAFLKHWSQQGASEAGSEEEGSEDVTFRGFFRSKRISATNSTITT